MGSLLCKFRNSEELDLNKNDALKQAYAYHFRFPMMKSIDESKLICVVPHRKERLPVLFRKISHKSYSNIHNSVKKLPNTSYISFINLSKMSSSYKKKKGFYDKKIDELLVYNDVYKREKDKKFVEIDKLIQFVTRVQHGNLDNAYWIEDEVLSSSKYCTVKFVIHKLSGVRSILKYYNKINMSKTNIKYLANSINVLMQISSPFFVRLIDVWEEEDNLSLIFDYLKYGNLFDWFIEFSSKNIKLYEREIVLKNIIYQIVRALTTLHYYGYCYRNLRLDNFLIESFFTLSNFPDLQIPLIQLTDFKYAFEISSEETKIDRLLGYMPYCAPEIFQGNYTVSSDIWSLGTLSYHLLTGKMLFHGKDVDFFKKIIEFKILKLESLTDLSDNAINFLNTMLNIVPNQRPSSFNLINHPWFDDLCLNDQSLLESAFLSQNTDAYFNVSDLENKHVWINDKLKRISTTKFFREIIMMMITYILPSKYIPNILKYLFLKLDTRKLGVLTYYDMFKLIEEVDSEADEEFKLSIVYTLDLFDFGEIRYDQFVSLFIHPDHNVPAEYIRLTFWKFDQLRCGLINTENLKKIFKGIYSENVLENFIKSIDRDGNKYIDYEEFQWIVKNA